MNIIPSKRVQSLTAYAFAAVDEKVAELKAKGLKPIDFGVGDYLDPTPPIVRERAKSAIDQRADSGYPSYIGDGGFRQAACDWMKRRFGVDIDPATEICSTIGSKEGVFNFHEGFIDPGDLVLVPSPGYPPYKRGTLFAEGKAWFYPLTRDNGFLPNLDAIPAEVARRAKLMWVCYPNSPSGAIASKDTLAGIVDFCRRHEIILAGDEAYSELYFGKEAPHSLLEFSKDGVVATFSMSKRSIMTGWRCGWFAGDRRIIEIFKKVKTNIDSGTPTFIQDAAAAALADETHVAELRERTRRKRDLICDALVAAGLEDCRPAGAIYIWQRAPKGMTGLRFAELLMERAHVVTTPGEWIADPLADGGNPGSDYVRFALVPSLEECEKAAQRLSALTFA